MGKSKDSLIYVKDELNKGAGDTVYSGLRMQLTGAGVLGDATQEGNEEEMSLYRDSLVINQLRHATRSGGEMSEQRVPFSVREEGLDGLKDWWADRLDTAFFNQIGGVETAATGYDGGQTPTAPTSAAGNTRVIYGAGATSTTASMTLSGSATSSSKGNTFHNLPAIINKLVNIAKISTPMIRPLRVDGQYKYVLFLHPNQVRQMREGALNSTNITWFDIMRARAEGGDYKNNPIYNGALGECNGVIHHESPRVPALSTDSALKKAIFCGAQAATFATGRRDKGVEMKWVEEYFDYENQLGISAGMIFGLKKMVFNSIDFSTIVCYSKSTDPT